MVTPLTLWLSLYMYIHTCVRAIEHATLLSTLAPTVCHYSASLVKREFYLFSLLFQVSAWGGYVFIINLVPLHVFILILMGRFSNRYYVYCMCMTLMPFVAADLHSSIHTITYILGFQLIHTFSLTSLSFPSLSSLSFYLSLSPLSSHSLFLSLFFPTLFLPRIYVAYVTFYLLGLIMSMQVPFVGFQPIRTSEHMAAAGVFALLNAYGLLKYLQARLTGRQFRKLFFAAVVTSAGLVFVAVVLLTYLGYVAPWSGRFYSLYDTG